MKFPPDDQTINTVCITTTFKFLQIKKHLKEVLLMDETLFRDIKSRNHGQCKTMKADI